MYNVPQAMVPPPVMVPPVMIPPSRRIEQMNINQGTQINPELYDPSFSNYNPQPPAFPNPVFIPFAPRILPSSGLPYQGKFAQFSHNTGIYETQDRFITPDERLKRNTKETMIEQLEMLLGDECEVSVDSDKYSGKYSSEDSGEDSDEDFNRESNRYKPKSMKTPEREHMAPRSGGNYRPRSKRVSAMRKRFEEDDDEEYDRMLAGLADAQGGCRGIRVDDATRDHAQGYNCTNFKEKSSDNKYMPCMYYKSDKQDTVNEQVVCSRMHDMNRKVDARRSRQTLRGRSGSR